MDKLEITIVDQVLVDEIAKKNNHGKPTQKDEDEATEHCLAICFLRGTNAEYASYMKELYNAQLNGRDEYPRTLHEAFRILRLRQEPGPRSGRY